MTPSPRPRPRPRAGPLPSSGHGETGPSRQGSRQDRQRLESYGDGGFRISGVRHVGPVLVLPEATLPWTVSDPSAPTIESLAPVLDCDPPVDILLFGGGPQLVPVDEGLRAALHDAGIAVEPMDTGAACRTYSVLAAEERRVAAALIPVD